jgi:hypothetical protein
MLRQSGAVVGRHLALRYRPASASNQLAHRPLLVRLYSDKEAGDDAAGGGFFARLTEK